MTEPFDQTEPTETPARYVPSPTAARAILAMRDGPVDEMRFIVLRGPRGCGKTTWAIFACCALAERLPVESRPLQVAVVRDTWTNLSRTTLVSFDENRRKGLDLEITKGGLEATIIPEDPLVHFSFFGLDRPDDADKLQGFACGVLWLEEVAPAAGIASGVPASVLGIGATSVRQAGVPPRILVTMNPPDKNHWILKAEDHIHQAGLEGVRVKHFVMGPHEKAAHFRAMAGLEAQHPDLAKGWTQAADAADAYMARNRVFLESIGRPDLVARLVEGEIGEVRLGAAVIPNFSRRLHVADRPLRIVRGVAITRGLDAGANDLHPAVCWCQIGPDWINVLGSRVGTNLSFEEFIRQEMWPFERKYRLLKARPNLKLPAGARGGFTFRNIGDPAMFSTDGRSNRTAALVFEGLVGEGVEAAPVEWSARREAGFAAFARKGPGDRMLVQVDPDENEILIDGLAGRYHFPESKTSGEIVADLTAAKRVSGLHSHPCDALLYVLAVVFPAHQWVASAMKERSPDPGQITWLGR